MTTKNIGILGSGMVGQALAKGFIKHGYHVMIGTRTPSKLNEFVSESGHIHVGSFEETASFGDIIVLAVKGTAAKDVLNLAKTENLEGKTIMDATNPIADAAPEDGVLKYFTTHDKSLMEALQKSFPKASFVKVFSSVGSALMVNPDFNGEKPTMFIGGDNEDAKSEVREILYQFGWDIEDMGTSRAARAIEPLAMLWCIPGFRENRWTHAFKLLRQP